MPVGDICARCGQRPARYWSNTILGPVTLRVTPWCGPCFEAEIAATDPTGTDGGDDAEPTPQELEAGLLALGPIDWDVLRPYLPDPEAAVHDPEGDLAFVAGAVRRIAAHHGQPLPAEVAAFVARHDSPSQPAT